MRNFNSAIAGAFASGRASAISVTGAFFKLLRTGPAVLPLRFSQGFTAFPRFQTAVSPNGAIEPDGCQRNLSPCTTTTCARPNLALQAVSFFRLWIHFKPLCTTPHRRSQTGLQTKQFHVKTATPGVRAAGDLTLSGYAIAGLAGATPRNLASLPHSVNNSRACA
jgi:hypothetical protein